MAVRAIKMSDAVTAKLIDLAKKAHGTVQVGFNFNIDEICFFICYFLLKVRLTQFLLPIESYT